MAQALPRLKISATFSPMTFWRVDANRGSTNSCNKFAACGEDLWEAVERVEILFGLAGFPE